MKTLLICGLVSLAATQQHAAANWNGLLELDVYATHGIVSPSVLPTEPVKKQNTNAGILKDASIIEAMPQVLMPLEVLLWERNCNAGTQIIAQEISGPAPLDFNYIDRKLSLSRR